MKEQKEYKYIDVMQADILKQRADDTESVARTVEISPTNPVNIAPNIAMRPAPSTRDMAAQKWSRFQKNYLAKKCHGEITCQVAFNPLTLESLELSS